MRRIFSRTVLPLAIVLAAVFIMVLPLLRPGFIVSDDGNWMIIRLSAFYQSLRDGQFPVRLLGRLNNSYGYPVANFLYPGYLYIGSVLHVLGLSFADSVKAIIVLSVGLGVIFLYYWLRLRFSVRASVLGSLVFVFMPYVVFDIYKRGSVGEILAISMAQIVLYAIEKPVRWLIPIAFGLLAISHNTLALFFITVLIGYIVYKKYWPVLWLSITGIGMSSFFWIPAIVEQGHVRFSGSVVSDPNYYFTVSNTLMLSGLPILLGSLLTIINNRRRQKETVYFIGILFGSAFFASSASAILWRIPILTTIVQFPFRFLALWSFTAPWVCAYIIDHFDKRYGIAVVAVLIWFLYLTLPYRQTESIIHEEGYYTTNEGTTTVANEYMPLWVKQIPTARSGTRFEIIDGNAEIMEKRVNTNTIDVVIRAEEESIIQINSLYYPGWGAIINNEKAIIDWDNPAGLMRITVPAGTHSVYMSFRETVGRFIADMISVLCFVLAVVLLISDTRSVNTNQYKKNI